MNSSPSSTRRVATGTVARDPRTGIQLRIGVMGSASEAAEPAVVEACRALGRAFAARGCCLLTGACPGLPHDTVCGAKEAGGHVAGISPASTLKEHVERFDAPYEQRKLIGVLQGTGGITTALPALEERLAEKRTGAEVLYDASPVGLVTRLVDRYLSEDYICACHPDNLKEGVPT